MPMRDDDALNAQVLDELLEFASRGQGLEARKRLGKPMPPGMDAPPPDEMGGDEMGGGAPFGEDIPGMDAPEDAGTEGEPPMEDELDPEALKAALAALGG